MYVIITPLMEISTSKGFLDSVKYLCPVLEYICFCIKGMVMQAYQDTSGMLPTPPPPKYIYCVVWLTRVI